MKKVNKNQNQGANSNNGANGGNNKKPETKAPFMEKVRKRWDTFRATKGGRWTIRGAKAAGLLMALGITADKAYKAGQKHPEAPEKEPEKAPEPVTEETTEAEPAEAPAEN